MDFWDDDETDVAQHHFGAVFCCGRHLFRYCCALYFYDLAAQSLASGKVVWRQTVQLSGPAVTGVQWPVALLYRCREPDHRLQFDDGGSAGTLGQAYRRVCGLVLGDGLLQPDHSTGRLTAAQGAHANRHRHCFDSGGVWDVG